MITKLIHCLVGVFLCSALVSGVSSAEKPKCKPTPPDSLGPFYEPNAPLRTSVGEGYVLTGEVKATPDCSPVPGARIELWLAGPDGKYDDQHRATIFSGQTGEYRFASNVPPKYTNRPPHIHIRVSAEGYKTLVAQHYPEDGSKQGTFDLVLVPTS